MFKKIFLSALFAVALLLPAGCATLVSPQDRALTQRVNEALGPEYTFTVVPLAVGDRVYLSGEVEQFSDLLAIRQTTLSVPGVKTVLDDDVRVKALTGGSADPDSDGGK